MSSPALSMAQFVNAMTPKLINMDKDEEIRQIFMALDTQCKGQHVHLYVYL